MKTVGGWKFKTVLFASCEKKIRMPTWCGRFLHNKPFQRFYNSLTSLSKQGILFWEITRMIYNLRVDSAPIFRSHEYVYFYIFYENIYFLCGRVGQCYLEVCQSCFQLGVIHKERQEDFEKSVICERPEKWGHMVGSRKSPKDVGPNCGQPRGSRARLAVQAAGYEAGSRRWGGWRGRPGSRS